MNSTVPRAAVPGKASDPATPSPSIGSGSALLAREAPGAVGWPSPQSHLDVLLQQTREQQLTLSTMADQKANMLMAASALVIPLTVQYLSSPALRWPAVVMILFCVLTLFLATYSVMPRLRHHRQPDPVDPNCNLLFFGTFARMPYAEFTRALGEVMQDPARAYEIQTREIYLHGRHLARHKYRFLAAAYVSFLAGVFVSGLTWVILRLLEP
jgi:hypothetical protein